MVRIPARTLALLLTLWLSGAACEQSEPQPGRRAPAKETQLVVFAAASLREAFNALAGEFQRSHPGVEVQFNFAGTQELRTQLELGAPADVFASADPEHMDALLRAKRVGAPTVFARNELVVVTAKEVAPRLTAFADLPSATRIVIGTSEVPIGRYTLQLFERASQKLGSNFRKQVEAKVVSRELNAKQVLAKVTLGEADAAIVYRSDAIAAKDRVGVVPIPEEINVIAQYPVAAVEGAAHPYLASKWVTLLVSARGRGALQRAGFTTAASPAGRQ